MSSGSDPTGRAKPLFSIVQPPVLAAERAEQALVGALLAQCELVDHVPPSFHVKHYNDPWHAELHEAAIVERRLGFTGPIGLNIINRLSITDAEKRAYLASLMGGFVGLTPGIIRGHSRAITGMWKRREVYEVGRQLTIKATEGAAREEPIEAALRPMLASITELAAELVENEDIHISLGLDAALADSERARENKGIVGISTGFKSIDARLGGLEPGTMTVLGGRPGMGKSGLGWQWGLAAARAGKKVGGFSLEMTRSQVGRRLLSAATGIPAEVIRYGRTTSDQVGNLVVARNEIAQLPLHIDEAGGLTAQQILDRAVKLSRQLGGLDLLVVDHLHIVRPEAGDVKAGATWAVGRVSGAMKAIAKETGAAVLVLAQLNRGVEGRDDKRPTMADLRQAGDIEQDADAVCFLYRPEYYLGRSAPERRSGELAEKHQERVSQWESDRVKLAGKAELLCPKVREGEPGDVHLRFDGSTTSFSEGGQ